MKGYLAKLAARIAPPADLSGSGAPATITDPFATVAAPGSEGPPLPPVTKREPRTELSKAPTPPPISPAVPPTEVPSEEARHEKPHETLVPATAREEMEQKLAPQIPAHQPASIAPLNLSSPEGPEAPGEEALAPRVEAVENTQAILLRKADAFMQELIGRRASDAPSEQTESPEEPATAETLRPVPGDEPRTHLLAATVPLPPSLKEGPSVVIGRLTVEVTPPMTPTRAPSREPVIVVRGRAGAPAGIPSSHRFGFSQF